MSDINPNLKKAIEIAKDFVAEVSGEPDNLQLEEVALSDDKRKTEVVYSFNKRFANPNSLQKALGLEALRNFKKIVIDNDSGEVLGMYNWSYERREAA
ncbi:MAG TPA: hypothetical protein PLK77_05150 [Pyrinomonadaceae bacterium]|nr:hypothetical protein [Pyrinomonadaceae bacterium]